MSDLQDKIQKGFIKAGLPNVLVDELLNSFAEAKRRYYRDDLRPNVIEGGRFSEAVFRILQWATNNGQYTPLGKTLPKVDSLLTTLVNATGNDSIRIHIPRTLRLIYDIRNKRDAAHLADGIDPNVQDSSLIVHNMEWVLAELVRVYHDLTPGEAHELIVDLVTKDVPAIQVFSGFPRVLKTLSASEYCLILLYWAGIAGVEFSQLNTWVRPEMKKNLRRTLTGLEKKHYVHLDGSRVHLTRLGENVVEDAKLVEPV